MDNPKKIQAQKEGKSPLEYLVYSVLAGDAAVHKSGADKYGVRNWRKDKILASTYEGAILRHFKAWAEGEDIDPDSGFSHLYHIRACCAILLDSAEQGTLIDDRDRCESLPPPALRDAQHVGESLVGARRMSKAELDVDPLTAIRRASSPGKQILESDFGDDERYVVGKDEEGPHKPMMKEIVDMERAACAPPGTYVRCDHANGEPGPWEIRFTQADDTGHVLSREVRGPYETIADAQVDARANPWNLSGNISIHKSNQHVRKESDD